MTVSDGKKKKSPIIFFLGAFFIIVIIMFVARTRSILEAELNPPIGGVEKLCTVANSLVAVSSKKEVCIWDWKQLDKEPKTTSVRANNVVWLPTDQLVWTPLSNLGTIVISNLKGDEHKHLQIDRNWQCKYISVNRSGKFIALGLVDKDSFAKDADFCKRIRIEAISPDLDKLQRIVTIDSYDLSLHGLAISDDGALITVVGQKNGFGWIAVVDVRQKKLLWQKKHETSVRFTNAAFSPDGNTVYAGGEGIYVYAFQITAGEFLRKWQTSEHQTSGNEPQRITSIVTSPDGRLLAASLEPSATVWVWNTKSNKAPRTIATGNKHIFGLAFSDDSSLLATSEMRADQKLRVWRMSKSHR